MATSDIQRDFEIAAAAAGLKQATIEKLVDNDYDSKNAVATITDGDLELLGLTLGQRGMLKQWITSLTQRKGSLHNVAVTVPGEANPVDSRVFDNKHSNRLLILNNVCNSNSKQVL